jgi:hypothetical protein
MKISIWGRIHLSSLFKWFSGDFGDIIGFVSKHATGKLKINLETQTDNIKIKYLDYDWSLNGK